MSDLFPGTKPHEIRAVQARKKAALNAAKKIQAAADALNVFLLACIDCDDASRSRGQDDGRIILMSNMMEYAGYLESKYSATGRE
ncbi:hypothetical protein FMZ60_08555 [Alcaligenaceae bacterium SJ-26]|nr:hypothetical protein FMZ60_08555 [Alcaligenaceae bacterium SJ-26]